MRMASFSVPLALSMLAMPAPVLAENWTYVATAESGTKHYIDTDSLKFDGAYRIATQKTDHRGDDQSIFVETIAIEKYDCAARTFALTDLRLLDNTGKVVRVVKPKTIKFSSAPADSVLGKLVTYVCALPS